MNIRKFLKLKTVAYVALLILIMTHIGYAADWLMRGHDPMHTGVADEIVKPPLELLWKYATGDAVRSSPAVSGSVVYFGSNDNNVYALNATTGNLKWKYTTGNWVQSSPAVSEGVVYVGSDDNNVYALNATTGNLKWKYTTNGGVWSSPTISGGVVYVGSADNNTYAIDASTGTLKWKYTTNRWIGDSPAIYGGVVYVGSADNNVYALNASTGALKWKYTTNRGIWSGSSPTISGGVVYVGSADNNVYALNASTGALKWKYTTGDVVESGPAISDNIVYVGSYDNNVYALNASTGALKWKYTTGGAVIISPAVSGSVVYVGSGDKNVYALNASTGAPLKWKYKNGSVSYKTKGGFWSSPTISNGIVYVGSGDNNIYAFAPQLFNISFMSEISADVEPTTGQIINRLDLDISKIQPSLNANITVYPDSVNLSYVLEGIHREETLNLFNNSYYIGKSIKVDLDQQGDYPFEEYNAKILIYSNDINFKFINLTKTELIMSWGQVNILNVTSEGNKLEIIMKRANQQLSEWLYVLGLVIIISYLISFSIIYRNSPFNADMFAVFNCFSFLTGVAFTIAGIREYLFVSIYGKFFIFLVSLGFTMIITKRIRSKKDISENQKKK